jgi:ribonuclease HI
MNKIIIYTDGSSRGNPGPGGWGAIVIKGVEIEELGGGEKDTTNNRMELTAALKSLEVTPIGINIDIYTDSSYLINGITKWIHGWMKNNWKTSTNGDVLNKDIWQELYNLTKDRNINWKHVKGHAGIPGNDRADEIATSFGDSNDIVLFKGNIRNYSVQVTPPNDEQLSNTSNRERQKAKAYSYISLIDGKVEKHSMWKECEARVKGKNGAKFRKTISKEDESEILKSWGV